MFDIGWSELLVIAVVAIVVIGPKELPRLMRTFGHYTGRLRRAAADFQRQFEEAPARRTRLISRAAHPSRFADQATANLERFWIVWRENGLENRKRFIDPPAEIERRRYLQPKI